MLSAENQKSAWSRAMEGDGVQAVHSLSRTSVAGGEDIEILLQVDQVPVSWSYDFKYPLSMPERVFQRADA